MEESKAFLREGGKKKARDPDGFREEMTLRVRGELWEATGLEKKPGKSIPDKATTCPHVQRHGGQRECQEARKRGRGGWEPMWRDGDEVVGSGSVAPGRGSFCILLP